MFETYGIGFICTGYFIDHPDYVSFDSISWLSPYFAWIPKREIWLVHLSFLGKL